MQLFDDGEDVARINGGAFGGKDFLHPAVLGRLHLVLHLHGFHDDNALAGFDFVFFGNHDANDLARHGSGDLLRAGFAPCGGTPRTQRARVLHVDGVPGTADYEVQVAAQGTLALDLEGISSNEDGENIACGEGSVHFEGVPVHFAVPGGFAFGELEAVNFAVYHNVVGHRDRIASIRPARRQLLGSEATFPLAGAGRPSPPGNVCFGSMVARMPAATVAISSWRKLCSAVRLASRRSRKPVSSLPARKSGSFRIRRKSEMFVLIPPTKYS